MKMRISKNNLASFLCGGVVCLTACISMGSNDVEKSDREPSGCLIHDPVAGCSVLGSFLWETNRYSPAMICGKPMTVN